METTKFFLRNHITFTMKNLQLSAAKDYRVVKNIQSHNYIVRKTE